VETGNRPFEFEDNGSYSAVVFHPGLNGDWSEVAPVAQELIDRVEHIQPPRLVLDLRNLEYCGSAVVALMVRVWKALKQREGKMAVCCASETVRSILATARLTELWQVCPSRAEAERAVGIGLVTAESLYWARRSALCLGALGIGGVITALAWAAAARGFSAGQGLTASIGCVFFVLAGGVWSGSEKWVALAKLGLIGAGVLSLMTLGFGLGWFAILWDSPLWGKLLLALALALFYGLCWGAWDSLARAQSAALGRSKSKPAS
jgi:anti-anti-sigma factor